MPMHMESWLETIVLYRVGLIIHTCRDWNTQWFGRPLGVVRGRGKRLDVSMVSAMAELGSC